MKNNYALRFFIIFILFLLLRVLLQI